jgi:hypothetical protein
MPGREVAFLEVEGARVRAYTLVHAASVLGMRERTLLRQLQQRQFGGARVWAPKEAPNPTTKWLLCGDDVDAIASAQPGFDATSVVRPAQTELEHENALLRHRVEMFELDEAVRYKDRVVELERENMELRRRNALLATELKKALGMVANLVATDSVQPVA